MKYLIVYAHPEPKSLSGHLKDRAVAALEAEGHEVIVSDLYAMRWKAVADREDFPESNQTETLYYSKASREAYAEGNQAQDIAEEQRKTALGRCCHSAVPSLVVRHAGNSQRLV